LSVSRRDGVSLACDGTALWPGAALLERAQRLLDHDAGAPYRLELTRGGEPRCEVESAPEEPLQWDDEAMQFCEEVEEERRLLYEELFGPFPAEVSKLGTLVGFWPGGCLVELGNVHLTCGLSNYGMPTPVGVYQGQSPEGEAFAELGPRRRRLVPAGVAGYGYELVLWTEEGEDWPLDVLGRLVEKELLEDLDILGQVHQFGSLTVDSLPVGAEGALQVLITPAVEPLPGEFTLANGHCQFLAVTVITLAELEFSLQHGGPALAERLAAAGVGQLSQLERESVI